MNILYKSFLLIKNKNLSFALTFIGIILASLCGFISVIFFPLQFQKDLSIGNHILNTFIYLISIYLSYIFMGFFTLIKYSTVCDLKNQILDRKTKKIAHFSYTEKEWSLFKKKYIEQHIDNRNKKLFPFILILSLLCLLLIAFPNEVIFSALIPMVIFISLIFNVRDFQYSDWRKVMNSKKASVVITEVGYVISESYTVVFYTNFIKLNNIEFLKNNLRFERNIFIPGGLEYPDTNGIMIDELPLPERYIKDIDKIIKTLKFYKKYSYRGDDE